MERREMFGTEIVRVDAKHFIAEFPELTETDKFIGGINIKAYKNINDTSPLNEYEKMELEKCDKMVNTLSLVKNYNKMMCALVAYKIEREKLWRGKEYKNYEEFMTKRYGYKKSSISEYKRSGRVIRILLTKYDLEVLPASISTLSTFAEIKQLNYLMNAYDRALELAQGNQKSKTGIITKIIAKIAVKDIINKYKLGYRKNSMFTKHLKSQTTKNNNGSSKKGSSATTIAKNAVTMMTKSSKPSVEEFNVYISGLSKVGKKLIRENGVDSRLMKLVKELEDYTRDVDDRYE